MMNRLAPLFVRASLLAATCSLLATVGCGAGISASLTGQHLMLIPTSSAVSEGSTITVAPQAGSTDGSSCSYSAPAASGLVSVGDGTFVGQAAGTTRITASCGRAEVTAIVVVTSKKAAGPLVISSGGTYSGIYSSTDPNVAAITVNTDQPVIIKNSTLTGKGDLIKINGTKGANVTISNVTGTAVDPKVLGFQRGRFVVGGNVDKLSVTNCTMHGVSYGLLIGGVQMSALKFSYNLAFDMEDRASDGLGGLLPVRPTLGHFVILQRMTAPNGAEVSWNQMVNVIGNTSMEDTINLYDALGSSSHPISVHDNYLQGAASAATTYYTGDGITTDGPGNDGGPETGYIHIENNQIVHTAGGGIALAAGHDIYASGNRIVSCGRESSGAWYAMPFTNGIDLFNIYESPLYGNNTITTSKGGLIRPTADLLPQIADINVNADPAALNSSMKGNEFTDPCLVKGKLDLSAEAAELTYFQAKVSRAGLSLGDLH